MVGALGDIASLGRRLVELGGLRACELGEFERLELSSMESEREEDALELHRRLSEGDPAKAAIEAGLADLRSWSARRLAAGSRGSPPSLVFVSGAPGSGKSAQLAGLRAKRPGLLVASADDFKERFKKSTAGLLEGVEEPVRSNLGRSVYIHRLTAAPSWEMVREGLARGLDLGVELLGLRPAEDALTLRRAIESGYAVELIHVGCSFEQALARAARRHFEQKRAGGEGRWIGLARAAERQGRILDAFAELCSMMEGSGASMRLIDNSGAEPACAWDCSRGGRPPVGAFAP